MEDDTLYNDFDKSLYKIGVNEVKYTSEDVDPSNILSGSLAGSISQIDGIIASGKTKFDNTETGYILGLDNGVAKFYLGNTTNYLNFDGTTLTISGAIVMASGSISQGKTSFSDNANTGYYIGPEGLYLGSALDATKWKFTIADGTIDFIGAHSSGTVGGVSVTNIAYSATATADGVPTNLTCSSTGINTGSDGTQSAYVIITFDAISSNTFDYYLIRYKKAANTYYTFLQSKTNTLTIEGLTPNVSYNFGVASVNKYGVSSSFSADISQTTASDTAAPNTVAGVTATAGIQYSVVEWTNNTESDLSSYNIYRNTTNDSSTSTLIGNCKTNYFVDGGRVGGTALYYWVKAVDTSGNVSTNYSSSATCTPSNVESDDIVTLAGSKVLIDGVVYLSDWRKGGDLTKIDGGQISANTITTTQLNFTPVQGTDVIAKINASVEGIKIDADNISISGSTTFSSGYDPSAKVDEVGGTYDSAASGARVRIFPDANTGILVIDDGANNVLQALVGGTNVGDVIMGSESTGQYAKWDKSAGEFIVNDSILAYNFFFGDRSDGDVTISADTTLTADKFYDELTINSSYTLFTAGYRVFANKITNNGTISVVGGNGGNGGNGQNGAGGTAGAAGTAGGGNGTYDGRGKAGKAGGAGGYYTGTGGGTAGSAGTNGDGQTKSIGVDGKAGAAGGGTFSAGGGAAGTAGTGSGTIYNQVRNYWSAYSMYDVLPGSTIQQFTSSSGSGSSGGGGAGAGTGEWGAGGGGGGSGGSGGITCLFAREIVNGATGVITAKGGNGGNGGNGACSANASAGAGGSGGPGGSGGVIIIVYSKLTDSGSITVAGGTKGTKGTPIRSSGGPDLSNDESDGTDGNTGKIIYLRV